MMTSLELFDSRTISDARVTGEDAQKALRYVKMLMRDGVEKHVENIRGDVYALIIDRIWLLPIFVPKIPSKNMSYVGSLYSHYISYALDELHELRSPVGRFAARGALYGLGYILRIASVDRAVFINNWLLSTNLYPDMPAERIPDISTFVAKKFPKRFVVWNSVNIKTTPDLHDEFMRRGYMALFSRSIWIQDMYDNLGSKINGNIRREHALRDSSPYHASQRFDARRISDLYAELYIDKYSKYNPIFTQHFMSETRKYKLLTYQTLAKADSPVDGALGYIVLRNVLTTPILGYDTDAPREAGLYRILSIQLQDIAKSNGYIFHSSAGVGEFKRSRGAKNYREYRMIYPGNVHLGRRLAMKMLAKLTNLLATHIIEKRGL